jgi:DNA polymerase III alpha subunit
MNVLQSASQRVKLGMPYANFVHLRLHTAYSLAEGAIRIKPLIKTCLAEGMPAVGITDTGNLFGALEFSSACAEAGIQPIIGVQLAVRREEEPNRGFGGIEKKPEPDQLVLLAQNEAGYLNLLKLVSKAFMETDAGETPQVTIEAVEHYSAGLIALTGGAFRRCRPAAGRWPQGSRRSHFAATGQGLFGAPLYRVAAPWAGDRGSHRAGFYRSRLST